MNEIVENLMLEHLKALRAGQTRLENDMRDVKLRLTNLEHGQAHFFRPWLNSNPPST